MALRIVLVDDQPQFVAFARARLERHPDLDIMAEANDPEGLWRVFAEGLPDAVLLDVWLGQHNGLEVCLKLRQTFPELRALLMSADAEACSDRLAQAHGAVGFLPKKHLGAERVLDLLGAGAA